MKSLIVLLCAFLSVLIVKRAEAQTRPPDLAALLDVQTWQNLHNIFKSELKPAPYVKPSMHVRVYDHQTNADITNRMSQLCADLKYDQREVFKTYAELEAELSRIRDQLSRVSLTDHEIAGLASEFAVAAGSLRQISLQMGHLAHPKFNEVNYRVQLTWQIDRKNVTEYLVQTAELSDDEQAARNDFISSRLSRRKKDDTRFLNEIPGIPGAVKIPPLTPRFDLNRGFTMRSYPTGFRITRYDGFLDEAAKWIFEIGGSAWSANTNQDVFYTFQMSTVMSLIDYCQILPGFGVEVQLNYKAKWEFDKTLDLSEKVLLYVR